MDATTFVAVACGVLGLAVGSFLNVVIWRVPRQESVVTPRSRCPECGTQIRSVDNVPLVSWIALQGRCRICQAHISVRYPLVELACGVLFAAVGAKYAGSWALPAYLVFAVLLPALLLLASIGESDLGAWVRALLGGLAAFAALLLLHVISPRGMGLGDVKLAFSLGAALGWLGWGYVFFGLALGFVYGAVIGVLLIVFRLRGRKDPVPFGPFLAAGAMTMVLWGAPILDWYSRRGA
jgi:leader peptidase (prepilin peptidase)/N-methyltransferase